MRKCHHAGEDVLGDPRYWEIPSFKEFESARRDSLERSYDEMDARMTVDTGSIESVLIFCLSALVTFGGVCVACASYPASGILGFAAGIVASVALGLFVFVAISSVAWNLEIRRRVQEQDPNRVATPWVNPIVDHAARRAFFIRSRRVRLAMHRQMVRDVGDYSTTLALENYHKRYQNE